MGELSVIIQTNFFKDYSLMMRFLRKQSLCSPEYMVIVNQITHSEQCFWSLDQQMLFLLHLHPKGITSLNITVFRWLQESPAIS